MQCGYSEAIPKEWARAWVRNARVIVRLEPPYVRGGDDLTKHRGLDCSGFLWAARPEQLRTYNHLINLRGGLLRSTREPLKRSTSARMERGLDGWYSQPVSVWEAEEMDLGFVDGHVFAVVDGKTGLLEIIHSRKSRGPTEEPLPAWLWKMDSPREPRFRRLTIGDFQ